MQGYDVFDAGQRLRKVGKVVTPRQTLNVIEHDPPDNRILECAVESQSEFIVTEDQDLLGLKEFDDIKIMRISEFLDIGLSPFNRHTMSLDILGTMTPSRPQD